VSTYDRLTRERARLLASLALVDGLLGLAAAALALAAGPVPGLPPIVGALGAWALGCALVHLVLWAAFQPYRLRVARLRTLDRQRSRIAGNAARVRAGLPERRKGERFKTAFELAGRPVEEAEHVLGVGMYKEGREVWVTTFVRSGVVVKANAAIGWSSGCRAAEDLRRWPAHLARLDASEIRQYHNHPAHGNSTRPSPADFRSAAALKRLLGARGHALRTFVVYWNAIGEWRILEYDDRGSSWMHRVYDAAE